MARRFLMPDTAPAAATDGTPPAPPQMQWRLHGSAVKVAIDIAGNVVFAALFFVAVIWRIFFSGRGHDGDDDACVATQAQAQQGASGGGAAARPPAFSSAASTPRAGGLEKDDLLALPVYVHGSSPEDSSGAGGEVARVECAVCISELRDGDTCRILPRCGHQFHAECVDRWFRSHITCPLCRAVVADDGASCKSYPKTLPAAV